MSTPSSSLIELPTLCNAATHSNPYDHSRPIDVHRWSDCPQVEAAVQEIYSDIAGSMPAHQYRLAVRHLRVVLLDLYAAWLEDPEIYVAYHRSKNAYRATSRYNALHIGFSLVHVINALAKMGYVENRKGFRDRRSGVSRIARVRATSILIARIESCAVRPEATKTRHYEECIILRERSLTNDERVMDYDIEYRDTDETTRMRAVLTRYNRLIASSRIELAPADPAPEGPLPKFDPDQKLTRRIFNGSFEQGGRFYGGWWVNLRKAWRSQIAINGARTFEVDFSGHHAVMLYAMQGIDYLASGRGDPYELPRYADFPWARGLVKTAFHTAVNARSRRSALLALSQVVRDHSDREAICTTLGGRLGTLLDDLAEFHAPISQAFHSDTGVRLQFVESKMAESVVDDMTERGVPVLCVHDSFVIQRDMMLDLAMAMAQAYGKAAREDLGIDLPAWRLGIGLKGTDEFWSMNLNRIVASQLPVLSGSALPCEALC